MGYISTTRAVAVIAHGSRVPVSLGPWLEEVAGWAEYYERWEVPEKGFRHLENRRTAGK